MVLPDAWLPWLAIAGLGLLHGLHPASGWLLVAQQSMQHPDRRKAGRALLPLAGGHAASVVLVVFLVLQGVALERDRLQVFGGVLLLVLATWRLVRRQTSHLCSTTSLPRRGATGLTLWSCLMGTVHGSGLMLLPALVPLCVSSGPAGAITASGSFLLMLTAVVLHIAAMLFTTHLIASGICQSLRAPRLKQLARHLPSLWTLLLALTGTALIATR
jgi:hypothetical protein